jgi:hypothetical protein
MTHFLLWSFLLIAGSPQNTQQNVGTKLVWHYTTGTFAGGEVTTYTMGDRRRTEYRNTSRNRKADGSFELGDPPASVVIQRCDLGQSFGLNTKTQEYSSKGYPPKPLITDENLDWDSSTLPLLRLETTTVDTGAREQIFGQSARLVIIMTKTTLPGDTKVEPSVLTKGGWYIDYERRISCDPKPNEEPTIHTFGGIFAGGRLVPLFDKEEITFIGQREEGLLVKGDQNSRTTTIKGTNGVNLSLSNDIQITEFYRGSLDPALFEVPTEFRLTDTVLFF